MTALTKTQLVALIEDDIIDRDDKTTLVGYALDWALVYLDRTAAAKGWCFSDLNKEEVTYTTISCTFATTDVDISTDIITTSIDIPTGTRIVFTSTSAVPTGLTASTNYYAIRGSSTTITVASTYQNSWIGTAIDITAVGVGTHTVTAYRERVALPSECRTIYSIRLINGNESSKLIPMTPRTMDNYQPYGIQSSPTQPTHYTVWKDWYQLYPVPDATYTLQIRYLKWQTAFAADSSTAEISYIDDLIAKAASVHIFEMLGEPEMANMMKRAVE